MRRLLTSVFVVGFAVSCGVTYNVRVVDKVNQNPLDAKITVKEGDKIVKEQDIKQGEGKVRVGKGEYTLRAESKGYFPEETVITPENRDITLALEPVKHLVLKAVDSRDPAKLVPSRFSVVYPDNSTLDTTTDGMLTLDNLREGKYKYSIEADEFEKASGEVELTKSETVVVELKYIMTTAKVKITDNKGNPVPNARILVKGADGKTYETTTDENGEAVLKFPSGTYTVEVFKQGYVPSAQIVELQPGDTSLDLSVARSGLAKVYFDFDMFDIRQDSKTTLDISCDLLKEVAGETNKFVIRVEGHADQRGTDAYNYRLSKKRANAVKNYLVETCGIPANKIRIVAFGERKPDDRGCNIRNKAVWENTQDNSPIVWYRWDRDAQLEKASPCQKNRRAVIITKRWDKVRTSSNFLGGFCSVNGENALSLIIE